MWLILLIASLIFLTNIAHNSLSLRISRGSSPESTNTHQRPKDLQNFKSITSSYQSKKSFAKFLLNGVKNSEIESIPVAKLYREAASKEDIIKTLSWVGAAILFAGAIAVTAGIIFRILLIILEFLSI